MWKNLSTELSKVKIETYNYDHPLVSGVLDTSSEPFINTSISESDLNTFQKPIKKYNIDDNEKIKQICNKFMIEEKSNHQVKLFSNRFDTQNCATFGKLLDTPDNLRQMTEDMLKVL